MTKEFPNGVYPVMLTPFTENNEVDYEALGKLIDWYIEKGVNGLFADCQSSEMFFLSLEERVKIGEFVKNMQMDVYRLLLPGIFLILWKIRQKN